MNWEKRLVEIRILLEIEPSIQRRWVWECREKILRFLISRYGPATSDRPPVHEEPRAGPRPEPFAALHRHRPEPGLSAREIRRFLEHIARSNRIHC